jgi:hypothetical protein
VWKSGQHKFLVSDLISTEKKYVESHRSFTLHQGCSYQYEFRVKQVTYRKFQENQEYLFKISLGAQTHTHTHTAIRETAIFFYDNKCKNYNLS